MRRFSALLAIFLAVTSAAFAEGTRTWQQSSFDEFEKGTANGIAIGSDGSLELAPSFRTLATTPSTYIWALDTDSTGTVFAAAGSPARVYRIAPDGQTSIVFAPKELQVQALVVNAKDVIYAATSPDGKVYKIQRGKAPVVSKNSEEQTPAPENAPKSAAQAPVPSPQLPVDSSYWSSVFFDPGTKYIWDLALDKDGNLYVATGDHGQVFRVTPNGEHTLFFKSDEAHIRVLAFDHQDNLIAGSDGSGLVYRISPAGQAFVLYSAPKKEITALAIDNNGYVYAAGAGEKRFSRGKFGRLSLVGERDTRHSDAAGFYGTVRHIGTSHQGSRFDMAEAERERFASQLRKLFRRVVAPHRMMALRRGEILAHGEDLDARLAEIAGHAENLLFSLAQPEHQARLREHPILGGPAEDVERALVLCHRANLGVEARDRLHIVREHVGSRGDHGPQRIAIPFQIGNEHFDVRAGALSDRVDRLRNVKSAAVRHVVAIDHRDHGMAHSHSFHRLGHSPRLIGVHRRRHAAIHRTERAAPRADLAENHERRRPGAPAFEDVRAARFLADRVQRQIVHQLRHRKLIERAWNADLEPGRAEAGAFVDRLLGCWVVGLLGVSHVFSNSATQEPSN